MKTCHDPVITKPPIFWYFRWFLRVSWNFISARSLFFFSSNLIRRITPFMTFSRFGVNYCRYIVIWNPFFFSLMIFVWNRQFKWLRALKFLPWRVQLFLFIFIHQIEKWEKKRKKKWLTFRPFGLTFFTHRFMHTFGFVSQTMRLTRKT